MPLVSHFRVAWIRRWRRRALVAASLTAVGLIAPNALARIVWETGTVGGHVDSVSGVATGTFTLDAGDLDCDGVDYSAVASPGSPGTWSVTFDLPGPTNNWDGTFQASSGPGSLTFGSTIGTYTKGYASLFLEGPITFSTTGSVPALPASLTSLRMRANTAVSNQVPSGYDFSGPFRLTADGVAAPNAQATVEGNVGNFYPFGIPTGSMRYQQVYASSEFGCPGGPRDITAISLRPDEVQGSFTSLLTSVQISLSTTSAAPDGLSTVFGDNIGSDVQVVYDNFLGLSSAASGGIPRDFDVVIQLETPFRYDPSQGNLLLDVTVPTPGSAVPFFDAEASVADPVSRVYALDAAAPFGSVDTYGLVTKFSFHFPSPLILDFGEVEGFLLEGGDVRLEGAGVSATARRILFDLSPVRTGTWGSQTNFRSVRLTGTLGTGTLGPASGGGPLTKNTLPLPGLLRLCVFFPGDCDQYNYNLQFTKNGTQGVGVGGSRILYNTTPVSPFQISLEAAPWTIATASVTGIPTAAGGEINSTYPPFLHGPASFTNTASQPSGVIQMVSPTRIATEGLNLEPMPMYSVVRVHFVPEPGWLPLIGAGVVGLLLMGRERARR